MTARAGRSDPAPDAGAVAAYVARFSPEVQARLAEVRAIARRVAPDLAERISYGIIAFTIEGRAFAYLGGFTGHLSLYPIPAGDAALEAAMSPHRAGKGTLRFGLDEPTPLALVERVLARLLDQRRRPRPDVKAP